MLSRRKIETHIDAMGILRIGLEWFMNPDHTPFFVAQEMGWLREAGLKIVLVEPSSHLDPIEAINSGQLDIAITEPLHVIADRSEGHKVIGFARFLHTTGGVMYLKGKGISRPRDMARPGLRIQYPGAPGRSRPPLPPPLPSPSPSICCLSECLLISANTFVSMNRSGWSCNNILYDRS